MILNLTQHIPTPAQVEAGVVEPRNKAEVQNLLTFEVLPSKEEIKARAQALARLAQAAGAEAALIGGVQYLMSSLEQALKEVGIKPIYSFSVRRSVEERLPDGTVRKTSIFEHRGWVEV